MEISVCMCTVLSLCSLAWALRVVFRPVPMLLHAPALLAAVASVVFVHVETCIGARLVSSFECLLQSTHGSDFPFQRNLSRRLRPVTRPFLAPVDASVADVNHLVYGPFSLRKSISLKHNYRDI